VDKHPKFRVAYIAGVLVIGEAVLTLFYKADIARCWPLGEWPGTKWKINLPATLFWGCLLVWPVLFIYRDVVISLHNKPLVRSMGFIRAWAPVLARLACLGLVSVTTVRLFIKCVVAPWGNVVQHPDYLLYYALPVVVMIFLCSLSELAISNTTRDDISKWDSSDRSRARYLRLTKENEEFLNIVVILANAILVVGLTELIVASTNQTYDAFVNFTLPLAGWTLFTLKAGDAFATIGATLVLFAAAELVPKQIAMAMKARALVKVRWWIIFLLLILGIPAYGVFWPVQLLRTWSEKRGK